ncbi:alpha/beta hydrolase [Microbacterium sp. LWH7-1.2]|uniref:alpha/beta fold hydrolase n=1 Tax=Microbacterium sp. LWH7-1.2 TaxID=3135257 RepID=UPI003138F0D3
MPEHLIDTRVGRLRVTDTGGPSATALLWHSLFVDERSWERMLRPLADRRRLVVVTGPGHGASGDPGRRYTLDECAAAAAEVLDARGVVEPVDWVGNAWGGHVGLIFAAEWPQRCRSLVALGTPIAALSPAERRRTRLLLVLYRLAGPSRMIVDGTTEVLLSPHTIDHDPDAVALVHDCLRRADKRMLRNAVVSISMRRPDASGLLGRITQPTLVVTGADHHGFTPDQARAAVARLARGELAVVPDSAYLTPLEAPAASADLVLALWARAESEVTP